LLEEYNVYAGAVAAGIVIQQAPVCWHRPVAETALDACPQMAAQLAPAQGLLKPS